MSSRSWTPRELALLREYYGVMPPADIAEGLGRSLQSVYQRAKIEGLNNAQKPWTDADTETVRRMNANGWHDTGIAAELGRDRHMVSIRRKAMGLPSHDKGDRWRQAISAGVKRQCERLGLSSSTELRTAAFARFARESGWPEDLRPREVQILNVLAARGIPMTRLELAGAIGMRTDRMGYNGRLSLLCGNGPGGTYTASLVRRGLVARIRQGATVHGMGKGRSQDLYFLGSAALAILAERARAAT